MRTTARPSAPSTISPPSRRGASCPDARSDLYSLGIVMYEMLTGEKPYTGDSLGEIAVKHMNAARAAAEKLPEIPQELERITLKAMYADINERYQSAAELLHDLDAFTQGQFRLEDDEEDDEPLENPSVVPIRSVSELSKEKYRRRRRRSGRVSFLAGTFGVLVTAIALFVFLWNFWLKDVFSSAERVELPNFVGASYEAAIVNDPSCRACTISSHLLSSTPIPPPALSSRSRPRPGAA